MQVDESPERIRKGLGIGLALVRDLVRRHGGSVEAHSEGLGKGSTFVVRLPRAVRVDIPSAKKASHAAEPQPAPAGEGKRVLIVDDNLDACETLAMMLELLGQQTRQVRLARQIDARADGCERDGPVHRPGIEEFEPEPRRQHPGRAALAGSSGSVDGDYHGGAATSNEGAAGQIRLLRARLLIDASATYVTAP